VCCDSHFQRAFTACSCVFKVITLIDSNQDNNFENATEELLRVEKQPNLAKILLIAAMLFKMLLYNENTKKSEKCTCKLLKSYNYVQNKLKIMS